MSKIVLSLILSSVLVGCSPVYMQLFKTDSQNIPHTEHTYNYENDTVKITYSFWADEGIMAFSIFNKSDKPLYIDWKKSNYISNSNKFNYWEDIEYTKGASVGMGYMYQKTLYKPFFLVEITPDSYSQYEGLINAGAVSVSAEAEVTSSVKKKPERVTFIPPHTYIYKSQYYLTVEFYKDWGVKGKDYEGLKEPRSDKPNRTTEVFIKRFSKSNSPIVFRNFLTFSFKEDFTEEFYVDNEFYIKEIWSMDSKHFSQWVFPTKESKNTVEVSKYMRGIDFYRRK